MYSLIYAVSVATFFFCLFTAESVQMEKPPAALVTQSQSSSSSSGSLNTSSAPPGSSVSTVPVSPVLQSSTPILQDPTLLRQLLPALQTALQINNASVDMAKINEGKAWYKIFNIFTSIQDHCLPYHNSMRVPHPFNRTELPAYQIFHRPRSSASSSASSSAQTPNHEQYKCSNPFLSHSHLCYNLGHTTMCLLLI